MSTTNRPCIACHEHSDTDCFEATERQFGTREVFLYWQCQHCGTVQIENVPVDLARHYPPEYFAFKPHHRLARSRLRAWVDPKRLRAALGGRDLLGRLTNAVMKPLNYAEWCGIMHLDNRARVLDVGCGAGKMLVRMRLAGFPRCLGLDPFISQPIQYANGAEIRCEGLLDFATHSQERFDLIMLHHAFEHLPDPDAVLSAATALLANGGWILLRLPIAGSYAWRHYRDRWFALDPPRHLFLPTPQAMNSIAARAGLQVRHMACDATKWSLMKSELYTRDICMNAPPAMRNIFTAEQDRAFDRHATALNERGDGDQAAFFLQRI